MALLSQLPWVLMLTMSPFLGRVTSVASSTEEKCDNIGSDTLAASNLLQVDVNKADQDYFGPGGCIGIRRSATGSCVLRTRCKGGNISDTEFAFVCFNPGASMPHALHSFGRGGFNQEESFDTKVRCKTCMSVDTAFKTGDSVVKNALAALPLSRLPSLNGGVTATAAYSAPELAQFKPKEAAVFGPSYCISTFRAPAGTCLIRTRCLDIDLSKFNVGVTCLDRTGGYTRYLFGKDSFKQEETFDTLVTCEKCLGVGPESSLYAMHGLMPRKLVEDVSTLKTDVQTLNEKMRVLQDTHKVLQPSHGDENRNRHLTSEVAEPAATSKAAPSMPTIMMARRQSVDTLQAARVDGTMLAAAELPLAGQVPAASVVQDAGAETAAVDIGAMQVVSHRRGSAIAELLRRVSEE